MNTHMQTYTQLQSSLRAAPQRWLITGVAGFIGANLLETLLTLDQPVTGLDNFSTGHRHNLDDVQRSVSAEQWARFRFIEGDIRVLDDCRAAVDGVDRVLHQAALGSVPRSLEDPILTNQSNVDGFLNMLVAARDANVQRFVYAASSSTYGDHPGLPKREDVIGRPLSPYAVTKYVNELYADVFARAYELDCIGLRYFNVFGPRQDPKSAYAAVIPRWFGEILASARSQINGDGETSRDFCYIANTVQANLLAAMVEQREAINQIYNVAVGDRTTLNTLFFGIRDLLAERIPALAAVQPVHGEFRVGDVRHSQADVSKANRLLGYAPTHSAHEGLALTRDWFLNKSLQA